MAKALKPLIIVLLIFNIAALVLGIILFGQREALKGRTQKLEQAAAKFAQAIRYDQFSADQVKQYASMDGPLNLLSSQAGNMYDDLQNTKQDLENTRQDLAQTKTELATTKAELSDKIEQIASLNSQLEQKQSELAQALSKVDELERETVTLKTDVENLNAQLSEANEKFGDLEADYTSLKKDYEKLVGETSSSAMAKKGLFGKVVLVNPDWNFVILDIGSGQGLAPSNEMLVHRADHLVGRVRVSTVNETLAVAEILNDWEAQPLRKGDYVISPES